MKNNAPLNILLVDDETEVTELLSYALRKEDYNIKTASSGHEALALFDEAPVDLLITDIKMPQMDGLELIDKIRIKKPNILIIVISAHSDIDIAVQAMKNGAIDFIHKPINHTVLKMAIDLAADKWALLHALELSNKKLLEEIEQRKQIQATLEEEKELLAVTLRSIGDGVIATDIHGRVVLMNKVAEALTGRQQDESIGLAIEDVFHTVNEKTGERCAGPVQQVLAHDGVTKGINQAILIAADGSRKVIAESAAPIRDRKSIPVGVVSVFKDITNEQRLEEELLKIQKLKAVGVLAGGIAHDFNNILFAILGNIELVDFRIAGHDDKATSLLREARKATKRAAKLTQQLLTFSKGGDPVRESILLPELICDSADFVLRGSMISCEYIFAENLWPVNIDAGQISQVIQNIIINANHAMPEGGRINIACTNIEDSASEPIVSTHKGNFVRITIAATGIGIPHEILNKIFDPYFSTKSNGSGLGLAICHSIINKHDGYITVDSTPGKGTLFTLYLPAAPSAHVRMEEQQEPELVAEIPARIMVMDDEEILRDVAGAQLQAMGHEALLVADGAEALETYQEQQAKGTPVDLVIMDLTIPGGMGGQKAAKKLLEIDPEAQIIVASGYSNDPVMANCTDYGFAASIAKPFEMKELFTILTDVLKNSTNDESPVSSALAS